MTPDLDTALRNLHDTRNAIDQAPAGHNPLACHATLLAELDVFVAAGQLNPGNCPTCAALRAMGRAAVTLHLLSDDDPDGIRSDLLHAITHLHHPTAQQENQ